jgi:hypothetical protein
VKLLFRGAGASTIATGAVSAGVTAAFFAAFFLAAHRFFNAVKMDA